MWNSVGIVREAPELKATYQQLQAWYLEAKNAKAELALPYGLEYWNQLEVALSVCEAAIERTESVGAHYLKQAEAEKTLVCH